MKSHDVVHKILGGKAKNKELKIFDVEEGENPLTDKEKENVRFAFKGSGYRVGNR